MFAVASGEQKQLNGAQQPDFFFFFSKNCLEVGAHTLTLLNDLSKSFKNTCGIGSQVH